MKNYGTFQVFHSNRHRYKSNSILTQLDGDLYPFYANILVFNNRKPAFFLNCMHKIKNLETTEKLIRKSMNCKTVLGRHIHARDFFQDLYNFVKPHKSLRLRGRREIKYPNFDPSRQKSLSFNEIISGMPLEMCKLSPVSPLRVDQGRKNGRKKTPAMAERLTDHV